jgi:hypothetical protein
MSKIQGEGDYVCGRKAREAADAPSGPETRDLEDARKRTARDPVRSSPLEVINRRERKLDESLEQTFPASDPAAISPGAD